MFGIVAPCRLSRTSVFPRPPQASWLGHSFGLLVVLLGCSEPDLSSSNFSCMSDADCGAGQICALSGASGFGCQQEESASVLPGGDDGELDPAPPSDDSAPPPDDSAPPPDDSAPPPDDSAPPPDDSAAPPDDSAAPPDDSAPPPELPRECDAVPVPDDGVLLPTNIYLPTGGWGNAGQGTLTGGTSLYAGASGGVSAEVPQLASTAGDQEVRLAAPLPQRGFTGIVFWFAECVDASAYQGLQFNLTGDLGGADIVLTVQIQVNHPIPASGGGLGGCQYANFKDRFSECVSPKVTLFTEELGEEGSLYSLDFDRFVRGMPEEFLVGSADRLVGLQFQFECGRVEGCPIDVGLSPVVLLPAAKPALE